MTSTPAPTVNPKSCLLQIVVLIVVFAAIMGYCAYRDSLRTPEQRAAAETRSNLYDAKYWGRLVAPRVFETGLLAPSTAKYPEDRIVFVALGNDRYRLSGVVDAQNGFGAMVRMDWELTYMYYPKTSKGELVLALLDGSVIDID